MLLSRIFSSTQKQLIFHRIFPSGMIFCRAAFFATMLVGLLLPENVVGKCDRVPEGSGAAKSPADGRFRIRIQGNPERYTPGEIYTLSLAGIRSMQVAHKFSGFMLAVEKEIYDPRTDIGGMGSAGLFQLLGDTLAKFSEKCPNVVTHTSSLPKSDIQVSK